MIVTDLDTDDRAGRRDVRSEQDADECSGERGDLLISCRRSS
jgi:hypothetical protein